MKLNDSKNYKNNIKLEIIFFLKSTKHIFGRQNDAVLTHSLSSLTAISS